MTKETALLATLRQSIEAYQLELTFFVITDKLAKEIGVSEETGYIRKVVPTKIPKAAFNTSATPAYSIDAFNNRPPQKSISHKHMKNGHNKETLIHPFFDHALGKFEAHIDMSVFGYCPLQGSPKDSVP